MKFEEVLPALKNGKKIRRKCRPNRYYHIENNHIVNEIGDLYTFGVEADILQDDWEVVKEIKKVKLRDLTEEQWQKRKNKNCTKYNSCKDCPFQKVKCYSDYKANDGWYLNKDLYSNKFLDQEIEVEE